jgi:predicted transcriptional regulator
MKTLKIGIMDREAFQQRLIAIAAGELTPKKDDPKVWFHSMKSVSEVLSDHNRKLLAIIRDEKPESITALANMSSRAKSNVSRTLKTLEGYGIVKLVKQPNGTLIPKVNATEFDIRLSA